MRLLGGGALGLGRAWRPAVVAAVGSRGRRSHGDLPRVGSGGWLFGKVSLYGLGWGEGPTGFGRRESP